MAKDKLKIDRKKSLQAEFWGLKLDENDLAIISKTIADEVNEYNGELEIEVISGDSEDTFKATDPKFFHDDNFPKCISSLTISYSHYESPISCKLDIPDKYRGVVLLAVDGENINITSGLFRELKKQLDAKTSNSSVTKITKNIHTGLFSVFIASLLLSMLLLYSFFGIALFMLDDLYTGEGFDLRLIIEKNRLLFSCALAFLLIFIIDSPVEKFLKRCFPIIIFQGRLSSDNNTRRYTTWILVAIILPILFSLVTSLAF